MRAYSMDLRERVAAAVDDGQLPQRQIARLFRVSLSFVSRLLKRRREAGTLAPEPHRGGPRRALDFADRWRLRRLAREHNDDTLDELRRRGGFACSPTTIWRTLRGRGLTRKKKSMHADESDRSDVKRKRRSFRRRVRRVEAGRLKFIDESGANTAMARTHAWSPRGARAVGSAPGEVGIVHGDRGVGPGRGERPAGAPGFGRRPGVRLVRRGRAGAGAPPRRRGDLGQPADASGARRRGGRAGGRRPVDVPVAVQPGLHADRAAVVEGEDVPPSGGGAE